MARLIGAQLPGARLYSSDGHTVELPRLTDNPLLICLYPGDSEEDERSLTPTSCQVQRAGLREHALDLAAFGVKVVGISCEPHELQTGLARVEQLPFPLLSDRECALADALELPTFDDFGVRRYQRLSLIARRGTIEAVFYPVSPKRAAVQALTWLERRGLA